MAKKRRGPDLYDMLSHDPQETAQMLEPPAWASSSGPSTKKQPVADSGDAVPAKPRSDPDTDRTVTGTDSHGPDGPVPPLVALSGACVTISLTSKRAAVAFFAVIVVAVLLGEGIVQYGKGRYESGFSAGRASYVAGTVDEIEAARAAPPRLDVVGDLVLGAKQPASVTEGGASVAGSTGEAPWVRGHSYIVVQEFGAGLTEDAERAKDFLVQRDVDAEIVALPGGKVQLITVLGYNLRDPSQKQMALKLLDRVHRIGDDYFAQGGGYRLQGYLKTLKSENW